MRIDQSRENLKNLREGELRRDNCPMYKQQLNTTQDRQRAKALRDLSEANGQWNEERRDSTKNDICCLVDAAGQSNPNLVKEYIYSRKEGFPKNKGEGPTHPPYKWIFRRYDLRKSGQTLRKPLEGKTTSETWSTVKTSAGSTRRKSDIAKKENHHKNRTNSRGRRKLICREAVETSKKAGRTRGERIISKTATTGATG